MSNIKEFTDKELAGIVEKDSTIIPTLTDDTSNVKDFLREYGVKDGATLVSNYKIYYDYCRNWRRHGNKISKIGFFRKFGRVFDSKRTGTVRYYLITEGVFETDKESLDEAKEFDRRMRNKIKKKNEQKKQGKVSRIAEEIQSENATGLH